MTIQTSGMEAFTPQAWYGRQTVSLLGIGHALPGPAISTEQLLSHMDARFGLEVASRGRIYAQKMNVNSRHLCRDLMERQESPRPGSRNPELAAKAVTAALENAGLGVDDIGYLIGHTATPAMPVPSNISLVAEMLGYNGPHAEMRQACTGFANALVMADGLLSYPDAKPVVIVGSETGSVFFDPMRLKDDPGQLVNMVQMGDGAGAVVLGPSGGAYSNKALGTLSKTYYGQLGGSKVPGFSLPSGGSDMIMAAYGAPEFAHSFTEVRTSGPALFLAGISAARIAGADHSDMDFILPHQANGAMDVLLEENLGIPRKAVIVNGDKVGNTGSAAIWLALSQRLSACKRGEKILILGAEATKYMFGGFVYQHGA